MIYCTYLLNSVKYVLLLCLDRESRLGIGSHLHVISSLFSAMGGRVGIDSGMVVVIFISLMYLTIVFGMLFYVKNDWCDLLFKNFTESILERCPYQYVHVTILNIQAQYFF